MYKLEIEIGIVFVNEQNFKEQTKFFVNDGVVQKIERTIVFFKRTKKKTNDRFLT